ncbi:MAG: hypothetical protein ABI723_25720 [Bacteroidia bacterium]
MYLIREVFKTKPGKAKELVKKFKQAIPHFEKSDEGKNFKVLTDIVSHYWTVVMEYEVEDIGKHLNNMRTATSSPELQEIMKGYIDLVEGGSREIFLVE